MGGRRRMMGDLFLSTQITHTKVIFGSRGKLLFEKIKKSIDLKCVVDRLVCHSALQEPFITNPTWIAFSCAFHTRFAYNAAECQETSMFSWSEEGREQKKPFSPSSFIPVSHIMWRSAWELQCSLWSEEV
jgi:hypothetical protein